MEQDVPSSDKLMPVKIIYGLYALGYFTAITSLAGVVYAYILRGKDNDTVLASHLTFQIRTFWISLAIAAVAFVTAFIGVGLLLFLFLFVWGLVRIISGFLLLNDRKPVSGSRYMGILAY